MWLFSVSIHLHMVFSLWITLSCIFKENLALSLSHSLFSASVLVLSEAAFVVFDRHTIAFLIISFRYFLEFTVSTSVVSFCFLFAVRNWTPSFFLPSFPLFSFSFHWLLLGLTFYVVLCHRWASLVAWW